ncbi:DinB family protein [Luteipulveratus sp. YIM 133132]|uniref:DinB family protein n=1 Tax=Luteipulveratus flavus TaxID=3031728 RepID=UPI0023B09724|nr:DinB family protein [Luteipulveratus sp. YIM 133132]MDE9364705.1 DinB family protein [Luteipulveratus sp. YIM 133132]
MIDRETTLLLGALRSQREHVVTMVDGLDDEQARRPVLPSGWSCLGLLKHLAHSDEHYWFACVVGGEPVDGSLFADGADWRVGDDSTLADLVALYREHGARADTVLAATTLDAPPAYTDPAWETWGMGFPDVRSVVLHVITETAVHAGHLDATRELIDGRQWVTL